MWVNVLTFGAGCVTGMGLVLFLIGIFAALVGAKREDKLMESFFGPRPNG